MPKLNFYDTDAVKAFLLNTLVENKEVREDVDFERRQSQTWFTQYQAQKGRAEAAEAKIAAAVSTLTVTLDARSAGTITAKEVDQEIKDALDLLTMSQKTEGAPRNDEHPVRDQRRLPGRPGRDGGRPRHRRTAERRPA